MSRRLANTEGLVRPRAWLSGEEELFRDARIGGNYEGATNRQLMSIARQLLG